METKRILRQHTTARNRITTNEEAEGNGRRGESCQPPREQQNSDNNKAAKTRPETRRENWGKPLVVHGDNATVIDGGEADDDDDTADYGAENEKKLKCPKRKQVD